MSDYTKPPYAYRLEPIHPAKPGHLSLVTAAVMDCIVTGRILSGSGGGGNYISPEVYNLLRHDKEVRELIQKKLLDSGQATS